MKNNENKIRIDKRTSNVDPLSFECSCCETLSSVESPQSGLECNGEYSDQNSTTNSNTIFNYNKLSTINHNKTVLKNETIKIENFIEERNLYITVRNARERYRVYQINEAFARLRQVIPYTSYRNKRISKVKTLNKALQYISELETLLDGGVRR